MSAPAKFVALDVSRLHPGDKKSVEGLGTDILVCNVEGEFFAVENRCTHAAVAMDHGDLEGDVLVCPIHGACFDVRTGSVVAPPARHPLRTFDVTLVGRLLEIRRKPNDSGPPRD